MSLEQEAHEAATAAYPELAPHEGEAMYPRSAVRYYQQYAYQLGYIAGATRPDPPVTDAECAAALRVWYAGMFAGGWTDRELEKMRAALEAARATREGKP